MKILFKLWVILVANLSSNMNLSNLVENSKKRFEIFREIWAKYYTTWERPSSSFTAILTVQFRLCQKILKRSKVDNLKNCTEQINQESFQGIVVIKKYNETSFKTDKSEWNDGKCSARIVTRHVGYNLRHVTKVSSQSSAAKLWFWLFNKKILSTNLPRWPSFELVQNLIVWCEIKFKSSWTKHVR